MNDNSGSIAGDLLPAPGLVFSIIVVTNGCHDIACKRSRLRKIDQMHKAGGKRSSTLNPGLT